MIGDFEFLRNFANVWLEPVAAMSQHTTVKY